MNQHLGISASGIESATSFLKKLLANTYTVYLKTHSFHWNVTGPNFQSLHILFENQYTDLAVAVDLIAERIRALGEYAPGSYAEFSSLSSIHEASIPLPAEQMLTELAKDHEQIIRECRQAISMLQDSHDDADTDLLTQRIIAHEKFVWMLRAHLA